MSIFEKTQYVPKATVRTRKKDIPEGLWTKCPSCGEFLLEHGLIDHIIERKNMRPMPGKFPRYFSGC
jgi:acetyl-CoA carboxylase beta subunit